MVTMVINFVATTELTLVRVSVPVQIQTKLILLSSEEENSVFFGMDRASEQSLKNEALLIAVAHKIYEYQK